MTEEYRVSPLELNSASKMLISQAIYENIMAYNEQHVHQAEIPAVHGITNARGLARSYYALLGDLDEGKSRRVLDDSILQLAIQSNTKVNELDLVSKTYSPFGPKFLVILVRLF